MHTPADEDDDTAATIPDHTQTILDVWDYARNTCSPLKEVIARRSDEGLILPSPEAFREIIERYESAKRIEGRLDYCDVLAQFAGYSFTVNGVSRCEPRGELPEGVRAYFFDECQDNSALVDACCRRLAYGDQVEYVLLAGDPFQGIYGSFMGGSAAHFLAWDAAESIMPQSYRCPENVMDLGERCLRDMRTGYFDRRICPAPHPGVIKQGGDAEEVMLEHCDPRERTLILARCKYSLKNYESLLDAYTVPFRRSGVEHREASRGFRALALLGTGAMIDNSDMEAAINVMADKASDGTRLIPRDVRASWEQGYQHYVDFLSSDELVAVGCTDACSALIRSSRWVEVLKPVHKASAESWKVTAAKWGVDLATHPLVSTTTIHGAKGMEADTVILCTQSSKKVDRGRHHSHMLHDEECRVMYVAVTRARKKLVIVEDAKRYSLHVPRPYVSLGRVSC
jgi:superfamily I DNA/RNA helicase